MTWDDAMKIMKAAGNVVGIKAYIELGNLLANALED